MALGRAVKVEVRDAVSDVVLDTQTVMDSPLPMKDAFRVLHVCSNIGRSDRWSDVADRRL